MAVKCRGGMEHQLEHGGWPWRPPDGFLNRSAAVRPEVFDRRVVPDPDWFPMIQ